MKRLRSVAYQPGTPGKIGGIAIGERYAFDPSQSAFKAAAPTGLTAPEPEIQSINAHRQNKREASAFIPPLSPIIG